MKPFVLLIAVFLVWCCISRIVTGDWHVTTAGNVAMSMMLCFTAMGHFLFTKGMTMMLPAAFPMKTTAVYLTGVLEILLAMALLFPGTRYFAALVIIALLVCLLPANIYAALHHINYEKATTDGPGTGYLWFRIPLQILFIGWVYYFSVAGAMGISR
jgi:uncharacterized membrane protein